MCNVYMTCSRVTEAWRRKPAHRPLAPCTQLGISSAGRLQPHRRAPGLRVLSQEQEQDSARRPPLPAVFQYSVPAHGSVPSRCRVADRSTCRESAPAGSESICRLSTHDSRGPSREEHGFQITSRARAPALGQRPEWKPHHGNGCRVHSAPAPQLGALRPCSPAGVPPAIPPRSPWGLDDKNPACVSPVQEWFFRLDLCAVRIFREQN